MNCCQHPPRFARAFAAFQYADPLRECVHAVKFASNARLARALGYRLADVAARHVDCARCDVVVPVPLHPRRHRDRGFNQAALLARAVGDALGLPLREQALRRTKATRAQSQLEPRDRRANVTDAFACREDNVRGGRVLLVDDVLTTGATADACTTALLAAGAANVDVLVLATN